MKFEQLYSSSSGSLYTLANGSGKRLLIECGVTWKKLWKALNYDLTDITACILTHSHKDHSKGAKVLLAAGIDVYGSAGTLDALKLTNRRRFKVVADKTLVRLEEFEILAFHTEHDAPDSLGFVVREKSTNEYLLFATDTSHLTQRFNLPFAIIAIECSYDKDILQQRVDSGDINETLAKRLLTSHMEKSNALRYIDEFCDKSKLREIHLIHCSGDNLNKEQARKEFEEKFFIKTIIKT